LLGGYIAGNRALPGYECLVITMLLVRERDNEGRRAFEVDMPGQPRPVMNRRKNFRY